MGRGDMYCGLEDAGKPMDRNEAWIPPAFIENTASFTATILVMGKKNQKDLYGKK